MEYSVFGAFLKFFEKKRETFVSLTSEKNYFFLDVHENSIQVLDLVCSSFVYISVLFYSYKCIKNIVIVFFCKSVNLVLGLT